MLGQCTEFKAVPGYGLSCKVSGIDELIKPKSVMDKNKKNLTVKIGGVVIDESSDIDPTSVISGGDNGEFSATTVAIFHTQKQQNEIVLLFDLNECVVELL